MKIIPLSEGSFTIDSAKLFVPFDAAEHDLQSRPVGSLLVEIQPFVIVTENDILLIDTGLGFMKNGDLQLHQNLKAAGIMPGQITKVLLSHLHKDHAGGISYKHPSTGKRLLSFTNAHYYICEKELAYAFEKGFPSFIREELEIIKNAAQVILLTEEEGIIDNYIEYKLTGGHSPFHQAFWIKEEDKTIFFGGDEAPQYQQMKNKFVAKYDFDGKQAMHLRQQWWQTGREENWTFLFYHDIKNPIIEGSPGG